MDDAINTIRNFSSDDYDYSAESDLASFMKHNANELGNKLMIIFVLEILSTILSFLTKGLLRTSISASIMWGVAGMMLASIVINIVYLIILFQMEKFDHNYTISAGISLASAIISILALFSMLVSFLAAEMLSFITLFLSFCAQYFFIQALRNSVGVVFVNLDLSLASYWKSYMILLCATVVSSVLMCVPYLNMVVLVVLFGLGIAAIVFSIWRFVLIWQCASSMKQYADRNTM